MKWKFYCFLLLVEFTLSCQSATKTFTYNLRDQLTSIVSDDDPANPITFTYDEAGNRTSKTHNGVTTEYGWSPRGDLAEVSRNGMWLARYQYNADGLRVIKQIRPVGQNIQEFRYIYDGNHLIAETNAIGNTLVRYHWIEDRPMGETRNGENYYYMLDAMGSVVAVTAQDGSVVARIEYDAFGNVTATHGSHVGLFGYTGFYADDETGLYYAQQRYYDSELGAFISEDPLEGLADDPPTQHRYLYARANPTKYVDKDGRCSSVVNQLDPYACDRMIEGMTNPEVNAQNIQDFKNEAAMYAGIGQAVGDVVVGTLQTAKDIGGTYVEAATGGRLAKGSMLRLRGQIDATAEFIQNPIDTVSQAFEAHNNKVNALLEAGDIEGAIRERSRFATTGILTAVGASKGGQIAYKKGKDYIENKFNKNPPPTLPNNETATIVTESNSNPGVDATATENSSLPFDRKAITKGFQDHHIISDKNKLTKNHELLELAGYNLQKRSNKIYLPKLAESHPTRSIHNGKHTNSVSENLANLMDQVVEIGRAQGWSQEQYRGALNQIVAQERHLLRTGERALNKHKREWAK